MKLTLAQEDLPPQKQPNGTHSIGKKEVSIIDSVTGEKLEGSTAWLWGDKDLITKKLEEPLLTDEYIKGDPDDAGYLVVVIRCDGAIVL